MTINRILLTAVSAFFLHSSLVTQAVIEVGNITISEDDLDTLDTIISDDDLAQTEFTSSNNANLFNGLSGNTNNNIDSAGEVTLNGGDSVTVNLDTSINTEGYDITGIDTYFGWSTSSGGRSNQGYEVTLRFVDGTTATLLTKQNWLPNVSDTAYWTRVRILENAGGILFSDTVSANGITSQDTAVLASGVSSITIGNVDGANPGGVVVAREIDVFGVPTEDAIETFTASRSAISPGTPITLNWEIDSTSTAVSIDNGVGDVSSNTTNGIGSITLDPGPDTTTTYTLSVTKDGDTVTEEVTVNVQLTPIILTLTASDTVVTIGTAVTLSWNVENASLLTLNGENVTGFESATFNPTVSTTYTLVATNLEGSTTETLNVQVIVPGQAFISEFLASNDDGLVDEDGDDSDWIEIHNPSDIPASLNGYYLTDDQALLTKWTFPDVTLAPGEYLIVFASSKDRAVAGSELHTNFGLSSSGEYLALIAPDGVTPITEFAPTYPSQESNISYGFDNTALEYRFFDEPSPGSAPTTDGFVDFVSSPIFSFERGFYSSPISVEITTDTVGTEIRYTTNGLKPTATTGLIYTGAIAISETTVLRAAAYKDGFLESGVETHSYLFTADIVNQAEMDTSITQDSVFGPQMEDALLAVPTISLSFIGAPEHDVEKETSVEFINFEDGHAQVNAGTERFGNRNTNFAKRSIRMNFRRIYGPSKIDFPVFAGHDYEIAPADEFDSLELRNGSHDMRQRGAYMSNRFTDDTMLDMGNIAPHGRFVHVYLNGVYWGQYHLRERWNASMLAEYFGGDDDEYEAINANDNFQEDLNVYDGDGDQWAQAEALSAGPTPFANVADYVDVPNIIDFMLLYATGNCESEYRSAGSPVLGIPFKFFMKDADGWLRDNNNDSRHQVTDDGPLDLRAELSAEDDPNYNILVADRIHKHYFNDGAFTPAENINRLQERVDEIQLSFLAESARWGERTPDSWQSFQDNLMDNFFPGLTAEMINRYQAADMYPDTVAPVFNQHGGSIASNFLLTMTAPAGTIYYTLDGSDPREAAPAGASIGAVAANAITYTGSLPLSVNTTVVSARVFDGTAWSALNQATFTGDASILVVSEIMYNPSAATVAEIAAGFDDNDDFEYIELLNTSDSTISLEGIQSVQVLIDGGVEGVEFDFSASAGSAVTSLAAGERVLIVENVDAFNFRYGSGRPVAGAYSGGLSNGGETLTFLDSLGEEIRSFAYDDRAPWPTEPDGSGVPLVLVSPETIPDHALATSWTAGRLFGGTPGEDESVTRSYTEWALRNGAGTAGGDADGDGIPDIIEYALGNDTLADISELGFTAEMQELTVGAVAEDYLTITFTHINDDPDLIIDGERSDGLGTWESAELHSKVINSDGTATSTYRYLNPVSADLKQFLRAKFELNTIE